MGILYKKEGRLQLDAAVQQLESPTCIATSWSWRGRPACVSTNDFVFKSLLSSCRGSFRVLFWLVFLSVEQSQILYNPSKTSLLVCFIIKQGQVVFGLKITKQIVDYFRTPVPFVFSSFTPTLVKIIKFTTRQIERYFSHLILFSLVIIHAILSNSEHDNFNNTFIVFPFCLLSYWRLQIVTFSHVFWMWKE